MTNSINKRVSKLALTVLIGGLALAHPAYAHNMTDHNSDSADTKADHQVPKKGMSRTSRMDHLSPEERVEQRIQTLHDKLHVTADQESSWADVANVMRDNEKDIHKLVMERHEETNVNAVDDLKSYKSIAAAHADGLSKLIPVFKTFYSELSDAQKATADNMFGSFEGRVEPMTKHKGGHRSTNNLE